MTEDDLPRNITPARREFLRYAAMGFAAAMLPRNLAAFAQGTAEQKPMQTISSDMVAKLRARPEPQPSSLRRNSPTPYPSSSAPEET